MEAIPGGEARIAIVRRSIVKDTLRTYSIHVDGVRVGRLWPFQTGRYDVTSGRHDISVRIGSRAGAGAPLASVDVTAGQTKAFRVVGPPMMLDWSAFPGFGFLTWQRGSWITLKPLAPFVGDSNQPTRDSRELVGKQSAHDLIRDANFGNSARGYDPEQVEAFLAAVKSRCSLGEQIPSAEVVNATLDAVIRGYTYDDVDHFLSRLAVSIGGDR